LRLSVADAEGFESSVANRPVHDGDRGLRRVRVVRRARANGGAVPVVLPHRSHYRTHRVGAVHRRRAGVGHARGACCMSAETSPPQMSPHGPVTILIAALGGQGGGVLTDWIVHAARGDGALAQATSTPGVSQRTGATTYYIEIARPPVGAP